MMSEIFINADKINNIGKGKSKYNVEGDVLFVEQVAQHYYKKQSFYSIWSENDYWWTIFGLLFWDIIFVKLEGVWIPGFGTFPGEFQDMPKDFFSSEFYQKRELLFQRHIKKLSRFSNAEKFLKKSYEKNFGKPCRPIENWNKFSIDDLMVAVNKIEINKLMSIMQRLAIDFNNNRAGFPDLFIFSDNEYYFVEVKSEKDRISSRQQEWHSFLSDLDIKIEICWVNRKMTR